MTGHVDARIEADRSHFTHHERSWKFVPNPAPCLFAALEWLAAKGKAFSKRRNQMDFGNLLAPLLAFFEEFIGGSFLTMLTGLFGQIFSMA